MALESPSINFSDQNASWKLLCWLRAELQRTTRIFSKARCNIFIMSLLSTPWAPKQMASALEYVCQAIPFFQDLVCLPEFHILQKIFGFFQVNLQCFLMALLPQLVQELIKAGLLGLAAASKIGGRSRHELPKLKTHRVHVSDMQRP